MISAGDRDAIKGLGLGLGLGLGVGRREMVESELEEGEACSYQNHEDFDATVDPDVALSYIDEKIQDVLGHFQKDFDGGVSAENLGAKFGAYGSFLPTYQRSPVWSHPRTPQKNHSQNTARSPNNLHPEGGQGDAVQCSTGAQLTRLGPATMERRTIDLDQGWDHMQRGITKLKNLLEGLPESPFSSEEYMMLYTAIYNMCTQKPPYDFSQQLYDKYKEAFDDYIKSTVLPSLSEKHDEFMLRELVQRWLNHKVMVRWLSRFFHYLDRYFIARRSLPALNTVGLSCFRDLVYMEVRVNARKAVIALIDKEREGEQIERSLLKNVLGIFVEIGMGEMDQYEQDFEVQMLDDTADYYKSKATNWIESDSCPDYMLKAEDCLRRERDRVSHYLHSSTEQKLVEKVQHELLVNRANQLLEKEHSGCRALLRDDKVEDLSRMYQCY